MKRCLLCILALIVLLSLPAAFAEAAEAEAPAFDPPALVNPEAAYTEPLSEDFDAGIAMANLITANNNGADIERCGAIYCTVWGMLDESGQPTAKQEMSLQDSPWGGMWIQRQRFLAMEFTIYTTRSASFQTGFNGVEAVEDFDPEDFEYYTETYRYPYYPAEELTAMRKSGDYTYYLVKADEEDSVEYVAGKDGHIVQLRVYERNADGELALQSYCDYALGPAWEIPPEVQAEFAIAAGPVIEDDFPPDGMDEGEPATGEGEAVDSEEGEAESSEPDTDGFNIRMSSTTPVEGEYDLLEQYKLNGEVEGDIDAPALEHPEARYTTFFEQTDGSEMVMFMALSTMNDTEFDVKKYGAVRGAYHRVLDDKGQPVETVTTTFQRSPYGLMMIQEYPDTDFGTVYIIKGHVVLDDAEGVHETDPVPDEAFDMSVDGFRFSSVNLPQMMNGTRQDEAGHTYIFETEPDGRGVESVVGPELNIIQLREYERDEDGVWRLDSYSDYEVGPAIEIPQPVLDKFAEIAEPVVWPEDDGIDTDATMEDRLMAMYQREIEAQGGLENGPLHMEPVDGSDAAEEGEPDADNGEDPSPDGEGVVKQLGPGGPVKGDFDLPAMAHPEERYEYFVDTTDGSDYPIFVMLDVCNDEAEDMKDGNALHAIENWQPREDGTANTQVNIYLQESPYGPMMIAKTRMLWMETAIYTCGTQAFMDSAGEITPTEAGTQEDFDFYTESYHFPYGRLEALQGARQDENGYTYFFIKSDETMSFEFVVGDGMRIQQLRLYMPDDEGVLRLNSFVNYEVVPALEVPQAILDAFGEVMDPVPEATDEPDAEEAEEASGLAALIDMFKNNMEEEPES